MKIKKTKIKTKSTFFKDFKAFISRGNILDLAVGVVIGAAFTAIVNSLVNDIIKPLIALLVGGDFSDLIIVLRPETVDEAGEVIREAITLNYGNLLMAILTFLIDALVIFTALRIVRKAHRRLQNEGEKLKTLLIRKEETIEKVDDKKENSEPADAKKIESPSILESEQIEETTFNHSAVEKLLTEIRDLLKEEKIDNKAQNEKETKVE